MKNFFAPLAVIATASFLTACAGTAAPPASTTVASSNSKFCYQDRLNKVGNQLECNWVDSAAEACKGGGVSSRIAASAATGEPVRASRCASGQWLVQLAMK